MNGPDPAVTANKRLAKPLVTKPRLVTKQPRSSPRRGRLPPFVSMPAGATFGTFVHRVLEKVDFSAPTCVRNFWRPSTTERAGYADGTTGDPVLTGQRPGGSHLDCLWAGWPASSRLRDLTHRADRLDELVFELPLAGGDDPVGDVLLS